LTDGRRDKRLKPMRLWVAEPPRGKKGVGLLEDKKAKYPSTAAGNPENMCDKMGVKDVHLTRRGNDECII